MLKKLKVILQNIINDIDSGNSNIDEEGLQDIIDVMNRVTRKDVTMTKYAACKYLGGMSRATFDRKVSEGLIPKGKHEQGGTLRWNKKDLDNYLKLNKDGKKTI